MSGTRAARDKIVVRDLSLTYVNEATASSHTVLDAFDLRVREGEFLAVLGPSGCGKSTLLNLLAGLTSPTSGRISVDGEPVGAARNKLGFVFQGYALFPWRTVRKNVETGLEIRGVKRAQRRSEAERFLRLVGLLDFADHYPHQLSGGMRQRVAIARVLAYGPEILLMDEPFGALDAQTRRILQDELRRIWRRGTQTVLFVTHDVEEAVALGTRIVVMASRPGRIKEVLTRGFDIDDGDEFEANPAFAALKLHVWRSVKEEVDASRT